MNSPIKVRPGERYYDRQQDEELTVLDASPQLDQLLIEAEGGGQEIRSLGNLLKRLSGGDIVVVDATLPRESSSRRD